MMYRTGFSGEVGEKWVKMDLAVDETDIRQFFAEHKVTYNEDTKITVTQKYRLLEAMAETYVLIHLMTVSPVAKSAENVAKVQAYKETQKEILDQVKYSDEAPF